jgi:hypothetical protein
VLAEDFAGVELYDGCCVFVGDCEDSFSGAVASDSEVVHASGAADADVAVGVEPDPVFRTRLAC